jgi:CDP-diacylglycerol---serine O-phosphatidyltransferase
MSRDQNLIRMFIPSFITFMNWFAGVVAILFSVQDMLIEAALMIIIAAIFDFFDGMAARLLNAQSDVGIQLDSLADSVSFGLAPGFIIYHYLNNAIPNQPVISLLAFIPSAAAVLRLAIFNVKQAGFSDFKGLPSPAFGLLIVGICFSLELSNHAVLLQLESSVLFWLSVSLLSAVLMLSPLKMFSFKFKSLKWKGNEYSIVFLIISLIIIPFFQIIALPLVIVLYILISVIYHINNKNINQK